VTRPTEPSDPPKQRGTLGPSRPFAFTDEGRGPAVVLVHGLPGSGRDFRWLAPALAETSRVVRLDMPGFGDTPAETEPGLDVPARARFVLDVTRALGLEGATVVGHSMGGVVATRAVASEPQVFAGLGLIASPGLRVHRALRRGPFRTIGKLLGSSLARRALRKPIRDMFAAAGFRHARDDELSRTLRILSETSMAEHVTALATVRRLDVPTFHAWSEDDPMIQAAIMGDTARSLGGARCRP
jgi:pimeloyl-ACP methyl ester carboxylesterase